MKQQKQISRLLMDLEEKLEEVIMVCNELERTPGAECLKGQISHYTIPWMKSFQNNIHQPGSCVSLTSIFRFEEERDE